MEPIKKLFAPPIFHDVELTRRARVVHILHFWLFLATLMIAMADRRLSVAVILLAANIFALAAYVLNRRGRPQQAGFILLSLSLVALVALMLVGNGINDIGIIALPILLIMAALILERRGVITFTLLSVAAAGLAVYAGTGGLPGIHPVVPYPSKISDFILVSAALGIAAYATHVLTSQLVDSLARSKTSEARLLSLVENSPNLIVEINPAGKILFVNRFAEQYAGKNVRDVLPSDQIDKALEAIGQVMRTGQPSTFELQGVGLDGGTTWNSIHLGPVKQGGTVTTLLVSINDVTKRKQAEDALRAREELYRLISTIAADYVFSTRRGADGRMHHHWVGGAFDAITGYTLDEYNARGGWPAALHPDDREIDENDLTILQANQKVTSEIRTIHKNGDVHWVRVYAHPLWDSEQNLLVGVYGAVQDITERKQAEQEMQQRLNELAAIHAVSQAAASELDLNCLFDLVADELIQIFDIQEIYFALLDREAGLVRYPYFRHKDIRQQTDPVIFGEGLSSRVIQSGEPLLINQDYERRSAELGVVRVFVIPYSLDRVSWLSVPVRVGEQVIGAICVINLERENAFSEADVRLLTTIAANVGIAIKNAQLYTAVQRELAERQRAEAQIRQMNEELEQRVADRTAALEAVNRELESFSYSVSHDLRAPLRAINGYARLILEDHAGALEADGRELLGRVVESGNRMDQLINQLLGFSRLGRKPLEKQVVILEEMIKHSIDALAPEINGREIEWTVGDLPPVEADPVLLQQVFANLIGNAVKYTSKREQAQIEIGSKLQGGELVFFVRDNGVGFDMRYAENLFGVFQRLHRQDEFDGIGIGLAMVKRIVERHGGRVWADSRPGEGATFFFTLD